ncbi:MAG: hydrogenase maturation nickel metallochaperone HypA [Coriobacteriia bacterium]|nr:hydrogenase maturation nickel metallochaperone HypA [Coriobacteriia bacterium]
MHEMGIMASVLATVFEASEEAGATKVNIVRLTVGELTEIVPDALQFAWESQTPGTIAEGAVLDIRTGPGTSQCLTCGAEFSHDRWDRTCTACGSLATQAISGNELRIDDIDVDVPEGDAGDTEE